MANITILGAGSWAMGIGVLLSANGHHVKMWSAVEEELSLLKKQRCNPRYLKEVYMPEDIEYIFDLSEAIQEADIIVFGVASKYIRQTAKSLSKVLITKKIIINVSKGIEDDTLFTMSQVILDEIPDSEVCVLSGPSHAEEVAKGMPTLVTIAGENEHTAEYLQGIFSSPVFRVYTSTDVLGIELGGSLKNVIALAAGMADGIGYGDNVKAALITRGIREISRLAVKMGAKSETLYGLSGMGDLIVTCASMHSRNRRAGILIGQGKTMDEAIKEVNMVVEGIVSAKAAFNLARKFDVEMPIIHQVNKVLFDNMPVRDAVDNLMLRNLISENK